MSGSRRPSSSRALGDAPHRWRAQDPSRIAGRGAYSRIVTPQAAGTAFFLSGINPKNLLLIIAGAAAVTQTGASGAGQAVAWAVFVAISSIGVAAPVVIFFAMGDKAAAILQNLKAWMAHNNSAIMAVLCLIIGVKLIGDAISGLST